MMRTGNDFYGKPICAVDGETGMVHDFYFDDRSWQIRYIVVDLGSGFKSKLVLISPLAFSAFESTHLKMQLTREEICRCPRGDSGAVFYSPHPGMENPNRDNEWDRHLRSGRAISRYEICTDDANGGKIVDLLFDDNHWVVRFILVKPDHESVSDARLLDTYWVDTIEWAVETMRLGCSTGFLLGCQKFDPQRHVNIRFEEFVSNHNAALRNTRP